MSRGSRVYQEQHITVEPGFAGSSSPPWGALGSWRRWRPALGSRGWGCCPGPVGGAAGPTRHGGSVSLPPPGRGSRPPPPLSPPRARLPPRAPRAMERFEPLTAVVTGQTSTGTARRSAVRSRRRKRGQRQDAGRLVQAPSARASLKTRPPGKPRCMEWMALRARYRGQGRCAGPMRPWGASALGGAPGRGPPPGGSSGMAGGQRSSPKQP